MSRVEGSSERYRQRRYKHLHRDPVSADLREEVLRLDAYRCVARLVARQLGLPIDACRNKWGDSIIVTGRYPVSALTLDHVKDEPMMGKRAPSDVRHLVTVCWHHHLGGWATSHRPELRQYLANREGAAL